MKKKLIGISVATFGVLLSIGSAIALYTKAANDTEFGISAGTYEGSSGAITYKINGNTSGTLSPSYLKTDGTNGGTGIGGDFTQVAYDMSLSASFSDSLIAQDFVVGHLTVSVDNIPATYQGKLAIWANVTNYVVDSLGATNYGTALMTSDFEVTSENTNMFVEADVAVSTAGTQHLSIYLKYDLTDMDLFTLNEASLGYSLSVSWGESISFDSAYVVGDGNMWTEDDSFAMVPNINSTTGWEWTFKNLPGTIGETKCKKGEAWSETNFEADDEKTYNVYWSGVADAAATYQEVSA